jgi:hypothetical protein
VKQNFLWCVKGDVKRQELRARLKFYLSGWLHGQPARESARTLLPPKPNPHGNFWKVRLIFADWIEFSVECELHDWTYEAESQWLASQLQFLQVKLVAVAYKLRKAIKLPFSEVS